MLTTHSVCVVMYMERFFSIMNTIIYIELWHTIFSKNSKLIKITIFSV